MLKKVKKKLETDFKSAILNDEKSLPALVMFFLIILSRIYGAVTRIIAGLYRHGILKTIHVPCFVISLGNIAVGGTGKTPMTMYIADFLKTLGLSSVVISRGYGGTRQKRGGVVGDGHQVFMNPAESGDEPFMMACELEYPVMVGADRVVSALLAIRLFSPDVLILDDGFQHMRLYRDLNILLLDCEKPLGNGHLMPAGILRESFLEVKKRADIVVFTRCGSREKCQILHARGKPFFVTSHVPFLHCIIKSGNRGKSPHGYEDQDKYGVESEKILDENSCDSSMLTEKTAVLFSGIAHNLSFYDSAEKMGLIIKDHLEFTDHHRYDLDEIKMISERAEELQADFIVTTQKDFARLDPGILWPVDFAVIGIRIEFVDDEAGFKSRLKSALSLYRPCPYGYKEN